MSSPPASDSGATEKKNLKPSFRFCSDCSNLLYPREDKQNNKLMYACRTCEYSAPAEHDMVSRKEVHSTVGDTAGLTQDIGQDPTLPRRFDKKCGKCGEMEVVFFQSQQRSSETGMKEYFVCSTCGNVWQDKTVPKDERDD